MRTGVLARGGGEAIAGRMRPTCDEDRLLEAEIALPILLGDLHAPQGHGHVHLQRGRPRCPHQSAAVRVQAPEVLGARQLGASAWQPEAARPGGIVTLWPLSSRGARTASLAG